MGPPVQHFGSSFACNDHNHIITLFSPFLPLDIWELSAPGGGHDSSDCRTVSVTSGGTHRGQRHWPVLRDAGTRKSLVTRATSDRPENVLNFGISWGSLSNAFECKVPDLLKTMPKLKALSQVKIFLLLKFEVVLSFLKKIQIFIYSLNSENNY